MVVRIEGHEMTKVDLKLLLVLHLRPNQETSHRTEQKEDSGFRRGTRESASPQRLKRRRLFGFVFHTAKSVALMAPTRALQTRSQILLKKGFK